MPFSRTISLVLILLGLCKGSLILSIADGNENIPTDGSGRVLVTDIGKNNFNALLCQSTQNTSSSSSDWYYNPTAPSLHPNDRIVVGDDLERGWTRNRERGTVRLLRDQDVLSPLEGIFTCEIEEDPESPIFLGIYYAITVDVNVKVISAREGTFTVTCTAKGGTVLSSSLSGPGIVNYTLMLVGTRNRRGDDTYSVTTHTIYGGANGDIYSCIARNGAATQLAASDLLVDPNDSETLTVASPPVIELAEQTSATTVRVEWSQPPGGATVNSYIVHYSDGITERSLRLPAFSFGINITHLAHHRVYSISVEATSFQLSGLSYTIHVPLTDEEKTSGNYTRNVGNSGKDTIIATASIVISVLFLILTVAGVSTATVVCMRFKPKKKPNDKDTALTTSKVEIGDMTANMAYNCIGSHRNDFQGISSVQTLSKLKQEPIYDLPNC